MFLLEELDLFENGPTEEDIKNAEAIRDAMKEIAPNFFRERDLWESSQLWPHMREAADVEIKKKKRGYCFAPMKMLIEYLRSLRLINQTGKMKQG